MSDSSKHKWTLRDIEDLIGQPESIRREYKSGKLFEKQKAQWVETLSQIVSAFANTEGGDLILGVGEGKSKPKVASIIDGVPADTIAPEQLQQIVETNISPHLPGMRVHPIKLSSDGDRVVYVIRIPQGSTAYQANDRKYYGRSEFEAKPLLDHEIRLRMNRGKVARAAVQLSILAVRLGTDEKTDLHEQHATALELVKKAPETIGQHPELLELMRPFYDKISFNFRLRNEGELTIRQPMIRMCFDHNGSLATTEKVMEEVLYPGFEREIPESTRTHRVATAGNRSWSDIPLLPAPIVRWTVFLNDSQPSVGTIDVASEIQREVLDLLSTNDGIDKVRSLWPWYGSGA